jgi:hypothetical protein
VPHIPPILFSLVADVPKYFSNTAIKYSLFSDFRIPTQEATD